MSNETAAGPRSPLAPSLLLTTSAFIGSLLHPYRGLVYDAQIYAVQALSRLRPALGDDLFLQNVSQDSFTVFPALYARVISLLGIRPAACVLTAACILWFLVVSWRLVARLFGKPLAWGGLLMLLITGGHYGASGVFDIVEPYLTARLPAEALIVSALLCWITGRQIMAGLLATVAFFLHPLMALPGALLLIGLWATNRALLMGLLAGLLLTFTAAMVATSGTGSVSGPLSIMDPAWVEVVRERSQFLFLQLWTADDWAVNVRPFLCLYLSMTVLESGRARQVGRVSMAVGGGGLAVAAIASTVGPVAILMQGQAWRWMWVTVLVSILLLPATAYALSKQRPWGLLCAILLLAGWLVPPSIGVICIALASIAWLARERIATAKIGIAQALSAMLILGLVTWALNESNANLTALPRTLDASASHGWMAGLDAVRAVVATKAWAFLTAGGIACWIWLMRPAVFPVAAITLMLAVATTLLIFQSALRIAPYGTADQIAEFAQWRDAMPPNATVFVTNGRDSGSLVWFTLQRNNYLSQGQSAGVVFSRATALEVKRRSEVLLPLADPNWKMRTQLLAGSLGAGGTPQFHALTAPSLVALCRDPALGFVASPDTVGFEPRPHRHAGAWNNWNLYDCAHVRARMSNT